MADNMTGAGQKPHLSQPPCRPARSQPSEPPPPFPNRPAASTIPVPTPAPAWLRTDWSETSFAVPVFQGSFAAGTQMEWAAKNATVALHDAYQYGAWDVIVNKPYAVYLAVCDVVLQRYVTPPSSRRRVQPS